LFSLFPHTDAITMFRKAKTWKIRGFAHSLNSTEKKHVRREAGHGRKRCGLQFFCVQKSFWPF
jgi:hypothetical protein